MAVVVGHSQTKYLSECLCQESYSVFSFSGYRANQFLSEQIIFEVVPFFSVVVVVVGAYDICSKTPDRVAADIEVLCDEIHHHTPSAAILLSEILPRAQNRFHKCGLPRDFLDRWNYDAGQVNQLLRGFASEVAWVRIIEQPEFHTLFGANVNLLSKDGLHLNPDGTTTFASGIEDAVRSLSKAYRQSLPFCCTHQQSSEPVPTVKSTTPSPVYGPLRYSEVTSSTHASRNAYAGTRLQASTTANIATSARPKASSHSASSKTVPSRTNTSTASTTELYKTVRRLVSINPREKCSCPSTGLCYHILAVKMTLNINGISDKSAAKNLILLRKNSQPRVAKKTGQKNPKQADCKANPAPDSVLMTPRSKTTQCDTPTSSVLKQKLSESKSVANTPSSFRKRSMCDVKPPAYKKTKFEEPTSDHNLGSIAEDVREEENHLNISSDRSLATEVGCNGIKGQIAGACIDFELINNPSGWLDNYIINNAQKILQTQFSHVGGLQSTLFSPKFNDYLGTWDTNKHLTKQTAPSAQIHYNGNHHWIVSYQTTAHDYVVLLDSLKSPRTLNISVSIQITQIYDNGEHGLEVQVPDIQRQENNSDCGVFAVANVTELLCKNFDVNFSNVRYDIPKMRQHLMQCIESEQFSPFPKIRKMPKIPCKDSKATTVRIYCTCKLPDIVGDMVKCDNRFCKLKWYHKRCVSYKETVRGQKWLCRNCTC